MIAQTLSRWPCFTAPVQRIGNAMQTCLHLGAHRCATSSFQEYMRQNADVLREKHLGYWGPRQTRAGLFHGILPVPSARPAKGLAQRAQGRLRMHMEQERKLGRTQLLISDESLIGSLRANLRMGALYCGAGERMARFAEAFDNQINTVALNIRSLETYWTSALTYAVARGHRVPGENQLQQLAESQRSWRDVITDIACAMPGVAIKILPFEVCCGRPEMQLSLLSGIDAPLQHARVRLNASFRLQDLRAHLLQATAKDLPEGEGRWRPFNAQQTAMLRENYADDLMWLTAGADGLAQLVEDPEHLAAGGNLPQNELTRGRPHDKQDRRLAGSG